MAALPANTLPGIVLYTGANALSIAFLIILNPSVPAENGEVHAWVA